jgi:hypothetical protein
MQLKILGASLEQGPKSIYDFKTLNGEIDVTASKQARQFCDEFDKYVTANKEITS